MKSQIFFFMFLNNEPITAIVFMYGMERAAISRAAIPAMARAASSGLPGIIPSSSALAASRHFCSSDIAVALSNGKVLSVYVVGSFDLIDFRLRAHK